MMVAVTDEMISVTATILYKKKRLPPAHMRDSRSLT